MKKQNALLLFLLCIFFSGCVSIPRVATYSQLRSITKVEKKNKGGFTSKARIVIINDFREGEASEATITALKGRVEEFIAIHTELTDIAKNNLREITVTPGATKEEVRLLLDEPDQVAKVNKKNPLATELWVYATNKKNTFTILFFPVYFTHEGYYLYFNDNILTVIERHYLEQTLSLNDPGVSAARK